MPITSQATGEKYVPQSIETHPRRIQLREEAELRRIEFEKLKAIPSVHRGPSTRKILLIICAVALVSAAAGGGAAAAIILTQTKSTSTVGSTSVSSGTTTNTNAATTTAAAATTVTGATTTAGAATTTAAAAATTAGSTTSGATTTVGPHCPGVGGMPSVNQLGPAIEEHVTVFNNFTLSSLIVEIYSQRVAGVSAGGYMDFIDPSSTFPIGSCTRSTNTTFIRVRCQLTAGTTIAPQMGAEAVSEINIPNPAYVGTGDLYFITATCTNGSVTTISGVF